MSTACDLGRTISCKAVQRQKAFLPISVTELGITICCKDVQPEKAALPISFMQLGISNLLFFDWYSTNSLLLLSISNPSSYE